MASNAICRATNGREAGKAWQAVSQGGWRISSAPGSRLTTCILLLRGGIDTKEKLVRHLDRMEPRYTYAGKPARGLSLFSARGDLEARTVLERRMSTYKGYYRVEPSRLAALGLLLPTFDAPHWTLLLRVLADKRERSESHLLDELLAILGPLLENPKFVRPEARRR